MNKKISFKCSGKKCYKDNALNYIFHVKCPGTEQLYQLIACPVKATIAFEPIFNTKENLYAKIFAKNFLYKRKKSNMRLSWK